MPTHIGATVDSYRDEVTGVGLDRPQLRLTFPDGSCLLLALHDVRVIADAYRAPVSVHDVRALDTDAGQWLWNLTSAGALHELGLTETETEA